MIHNLHYAIVKHYESDAPIKTSWFVPPPLSQEVPAHFPIQKLVKLKLCMGNVKYTHNALTTKGWSF